MRDCQSSAATSHGAQEWPPVGQMASRGPAKWSFQRVVQGGMPRACSLGFHEGKPDERYTESGWELIAAATGSNAGGEGPCGSVLPVPSRRGPRCQRLHRRCGRRLCDAGERMVAWRTMDREPVRSFEIRGSVWQRSGIRHLHGVATAPRIRRPRASRGRAPAAVGDSRVR